MSKRTRSNRKSCLKCGTEIGGKSQLCSFCKRGLLSCIPVFDWNDELSETLNYGETKSLEEKESLYRVLRYCDLYFRIEYRRSLFSTDESDPTPDVVETHIRDIDFARDFGNILRKFTDLNVENDPQYIGENTYRVLCGTRLTEKEIKSLFVDQSSEDRLDGPNDRGLVYPTRDGKNKLGILSFRLIFIADHLAQNLD